MKLFITVLSFVAIAGSIRAAVFTNSVSADSFVRADAPTLNYGGAGALYVSGASSVNASGVTNGVFDSFIRFNTAAMVTNFNLLFGSNNWAVSGAILRVTELGAPANTLFNRGVGAFEVRWIANDNWTEGAGNPNNPTTTGIAYNDEPTLLNVATDASLGTFTNAGADVTLSFPLSLPVAFTSDLMAGQEVGLFLTAIDSGIGFTMDSRSFGTVASRPLLVISAVPRPGIITINLAGTDVVLSATNGATGGTYHVLSTTNVALPLSQWTPVATNVLNASGNFSITVTNAVTADGPSQQFFILQTQ